MASRRREPKGKRINPTLFVFCEGETEEAYVHFLKSLYRIPSIQIVPKISGNRITSKYITNYKKNKPTHPKDVTYLMYDLDAPSILKRLMEINHCELLLSNPCIELWFLLHYKNHTANSKCNYFSKELKNRNKSYKKGIIDNKLKEKLSNKIKEAIKRAKRVKNNKNPSTTVYKLLEQLNELKNNS